MNSIDFSKAPEGATHYLEGKDPVCWFRLDNGRSLVFCARDGWCTSWRKPEELTPIPAFESFTSCEDAQHDQLRNTGIISDEQYIETKRQQLKAAGGSKHDSGKPLMGAVPPNALLAVAEVLTFGAQKYGRDNWRLVDNAETRYMDAALRHINAYQRGEQLDPESGENHLAHAVCSLMFILEKECGR